MKEITTFIIALITFSTGLFGQEKPNRLDVRFGPGYSVLGTGDMRAFNFENELNYKLNPYFTGSASINLGRSNHGVLENASFVQGNVNLFISPFRNDRKFDFRIGGGLTHYNISETFLDTDYSLDTYNQSVMYIPKYEFNKRNAWGCNAILESSYWLTNSFLIGLKLFTQPYFNGDINSGITVKTGIRI